MRGMQRAREAFLSLWACLLLVGSAVGEFEIFPSHGTGEAGRGTIAKGAISSTLRLVFFVGLEGTGHHFASEAFRAMYAARDDLVQVKSCDIGRSAYLPWSMVHSASHYSTTRELLRAGLQDLVAMEKELGSPGTIVTVQRTSPVQDSNCSGYGELSYPNNHGPNKALACPDLQVIAELAEEEGVDFRILYLQRSAEGLMLSNVKHRRFHEHLEGVGIEDKASDESRFMQYAQIILSDAAIIHSSLAELGPGFVVCHFYDDLGDEEQAARIADFLSPTTTVADYLRTSLLETSYSSSKSRWEFDFTDAQVVLARIQRKLNSLESQYCDPGGLRGP